MHLYRWDDYDDAKRRLAAPATPSAQNTLSQRGASCSGRKMRISIGRLSRGSICYGNHKRDWLPGQPAFTGVGDTATSAASERVLDFLPGGLDFPGWEGFRKLDAATMDVFCTRLMGVLFVTVGSLHRTYAYHWHRTWPEAEEHRRELAELPDWNVFMGRTVRALSAAR